MFFRQEIFIELLWDCLQLLYYKSFSRNNK